MRSNATMTLALATSAVLALGLSTAGCGSHLGSDDGLYSEKIAYTPAGELIAVRGRSVRVYDTEARRQVRHAALPTPLGTNWIPQSAGLAVAGNGQTFVGGTTAGVEVHRIDTGALVTAIDTDTSPDGYTNVRSVAISPDGSLVAVNMLHVTDSGGKVDQLTLWRVSDAFLVTTIEHAADRPEAAWGAGLAFSVDGTLLFGSDVNEAGPFLYAWRTTDGTLAWGRAMPGAENPRAPARVDALAVSADGSTLATASSIVALWRTSDGTRQEAFTSLQQPVFFETVALTADGHDVVATHFSNVASDPLLFGPDGSVIHTWPIVASGCTGAVFSPDGTRIAGSCAGLLKIWDTATGDLVHERPAY